MFQVEQLRLGRRLECKSGASKNVELFNDLAAATSEAELLALGPEFLGIETGSRCASFFTCKAPQCSSFHFQFAVQCYDVVA